MDRCRPSAPPHSTAVRTAGSAALDLLLPAATRERRESASAPPARPTLYEAPVLRQPQNGRRTGREPQTHPPPDAHTGHRSPLSQTPLKPPCTRSSDLPVPAARRRHRKTQSRLEHRYYIHSDARRLSLSGGRHGLVQPIRAQLGTLQHNGNRLLLGGAPGRLLLRPTRNLELRSARAVHLVRFPGSAPGPWDLDQHGWPWPCAGQCFYRTFVALAQVRVDLSRRLRHRPRTVPRAGKLLPVLQSRASTPGARLSDASRSVPAPSKKEPVPFLILDLPRSRRVHAAAGQNGSFRFTRNGARRTIENACNG